MNLRTEEEIIAAWEGDINYPKVSICCITYNHEPYIKDALEGFLMQETDFPFEILIHDDASTDRTADIIREYHKMYPKLIKPIYQIENQYLKGYKMNPKFNFSRSKGNYIAICEGDDYWTDSLKLQIQVETMSKRPDCTISYHPASELDMECGKEKVVCDNYQVDKFDNTKDIILGRGAYMPTQALMIVNGRFDNLNYVLSEAPIGDFFIQVLMSLEGRCFYINRVMSVYRRNAPNSWTSSQKITKNKMGYSFKMLNGISLLKRVYKSNSSSKWLSNVYSFYAINYVLVKKGFWNKINSAILILRKSFSDGFYDAPFQLFKILFQKLYKKIRMVINNEL